MELFQYSPGDRVRLTGKMQDISPRLGIGTVINREDVYVDNLSPSRVPIHFDNYSYEYVSGRGWDFHSYYAEDIELVRSRTPDWSV